MTCTSRPENDFILLMYVLIYIGVNKHYKILRSAPRCDRS
jgi:hypothetical protein